MPLGHSAVTAMVAYKGGVLTAFADWVVCLTSRDFPGLLTPSLALFRVTVRQWFLCAKRAASKATYALLEA